jgi:DNA-directed RNA polymerase specialized sigma54-like protein
MGNLDMQQTQAVQARQEFKLVAQMEQANLLEMTEEEFNRLTVELESSPLFKRLYGKERIVRYQRYPKTDLSSRFYQLNEEIIAGSTGNIDIEALLSDKEGILRQIQKIGLNNFKRFFLYAEPGVSVEEIAEECNLELTEVEGINKLINEFSVLSEFYHPSTLSSGQGIHYSKVASIERGSEGFVVGYLSPSYARGRYSIDYETFEQLKRDGAFSTTEVKKVRQLFKKLELINSRKDTVTQILKGIVEKQSLYFESENIKSILPFSQKELAKRIGLVPSSISRAIRGRSIETPWREEKALKDFFPRPKMFKKELVKQLLETREEFSSDEAIRTKLEQKFGVSVSRRSIADLRKELKFPPAWMRKQASTKKR